MTGWRIGCAIVLALGGCSPPAVLLAPVPRPTMGDTAPATSPLPGYATPTGEAVPAFAGPDPLAPEGNRPALLPPEALEP
jgi:hypothetical protein